MEDDSTTTTDNLETQDQEVTETQTADTSSDNLEETTTADTTEDGSSTTDDKTTDNSTPQFDKDLDDWATKTGRAVPTTDRERELYQEIRNGQREFSRARSSQENVSKAITDQKPADDDDDEGSGDPLLDRLNKYEASMQEERSLRIRSEYFGEHKVSEAEGKMMGDILKEKVDRGGAEAYKFWTNPDNLADWHALAQARLMNQDTAAIRDQAAAEERARIAKESKATGGANRSATTTQPAAKTGYDRDAFFAAD